LLYGSEVAHHPGINFGGSLAVWAGRDFAIKISVFRANGKRRANGEVGDLVIVANRFNKTFNSFRVGYGFAQEYVLDCATRIFYLKTVLYIKDLKNIFTVVNW
jgi:hypothetical protein